MSYSKIVGQKEEVLFIYYLLPALVALYIRKKVVHRDHHAV